MKRVRVVSQWRNAMLAGMLTGVLTMIAAASAHDAHTGKKNADQPRASKPQTYLALGDSYTIGEGVAPADRWPVLLANALRKQAVALEDPTIIATTGWTTDALSAAIDTAQPLPQYDFVTLLIGVNNQYRGRSIDEYAAQFETLLLRSIAMAGARHDRVMVLSIPDWSVTAFAAQSGRDLRTIAEQIDAFNAAARVICERHDVAFVDITGVSRARGAELGMLVEDGLHPSAAMYAEWVHLALPVARRLLTTDHASGQQ